MRTDKLAELVIAGLMGLTFSLVASYPEIAWAQTTTGSFLGTVKDTTGAVVPGVSLVLTNAQTGLERKTQTDSAGDYRFSLVPLGLYQLRVEMPGFETLVSEKLELHVAEEKRLDFTLRLAAVATTVEVHGTAAAINTTNAERADVIEGRRITELPLNFREFTQLALLAPGVQQDFRFRNTRSFKTNISVNGLRAQNGNLMIDGVESNDYHFGGTSLSFYNLDALQEFKITTTNYSAELRGSSYNIRAVTKAGTNSLHGTLYEFVRNDIFDARNFFEKSRNPFRRNQFGGTAGGYIVKDKLFWFLNYEGLRERLATPGLAAVPTVDERKGTVKAINPVTGSSDTLFVNLSPKTAKVINWYPLPNLPGGSFGARTFSGAIRNVTDLDQHSAKLDWQKSFKDTFSARWTYFNADGPTSHSLTQGASFGFGTAVHNRNVALTHVHMFSPNLINEFRAGYSRNVYNPGSSNRGDKGLSASIFQDGALETLNPGGTTFGTFANDLQFLDTVSYLRGRHSFKAGFEFRNNRDSLIVALLFPGSFTFFPNVATVEDIRTASGVTIPKGSKVATSLVTFLQGAPTQANVAANSVGFPGPPAYHQVRQSAFEGFAQDDLRVTPNLTINLGVRYEYHTVYRFRNRGNVRAVLSGPNFGDYIFNPSLFYYPDKNNFAPRIGFAYRAPSRTVIRGGFAIFTVLPIHQGTEGSYAFFPSQNRVQVFIPEAERVSIYTPDSGYFIPAPAMYDTKGKLISPAGPGSEQDRIIDGVRFFKDNAFLLATETNGARFPLNFRDPYVLNWNLTLERELAGGFMVSGAYVGNSGVALNRFNSPFCGINATNSVCVELQKPWKDKGTNVPAIIDNSAHSTYHSLQLEAKKTNPDRGYTFTAAYTLGKNLTDQDSISNLSGAGNGAGANPLNRRLDKGASNYDVRHLLVASATYALPLSRWAKPLPKRLTDGWQLTSIATFRSGLPFNIIVPTNPSGFGFFQNNDRPDILANPPRQPSNGDKTKYFADDVLTDAAAQYTCGDPKAKYFCAASGRTGTLGKGVFRAPGFKDIAFSLFKDTPIRQEMMLQFRAEFFNIFNFVNLDQPNGNLFSPGFGRITSTISTPNPPVTSRQIQFGLKLIF